MWKAEEEPKVSQDNYEGIARSSRDFLFRRESIVVNFSPRTSRDASVNLKDKRGTAIFAGRHGNLTCIEGFVASSRKHRSGFFFEHHGIVRSTWATVEEH